MSEQIDAISSLVGNMSKAACAMQVGYAVGQVAKVLSPLPTWACRC